MESVLKNISPKDYDLIFNLVNRLGIQVEDRSDLPDHASAFEDLKEAIAEIKISERNGSKLQNADNLINEL